MKASSIATKIGASLFFQLLIAGALAGIAFWTARAESPGRMLAAGFSLAALCVFLIVMLYMRRGIAAPLAQLAETIDRLAGGDTSVVVAGAARRDEIGGSRPRSTACAKASSSGSALPRNNASVSVGNAAVKTPSSSS